MGRDSFVFSTKFIHHKKLIYGNTDKFKKKEVQHC
jgi:hypothetical protein